MVQAVRYERRRRSIRLLAWDYAEDGAYFVTICTYDRAVVFGEITNDETAANTFGEIVERVWQSVVGPGRSDGEFVVMPNHVHSIVWIEREPIVGVEQLGRF